MKSLLTTISNVCFLLLFITCSCSKQAYSSNKNENVNLQEISKYDAISKNLCTYLDAIYKGEATSDTVPPKLISNEVISSCQNLYSGLNYTKSGTNTILSKWTPTENQMNALMEITELISANDYKISTSVLIQSYEIAEELNSNEREPILFFISAVEQISEYAAQMETKSAAGDFWLNICTGTLGSIYGGAIGAVVAEATADAMIGAFVGGVAGIIIGAAIGVAVYHYGSKINISGRVRSFMNDPLSGVYVLATSLGGGIEAQTTTDLNGEFHIKASNDATITFRFIGYWDAVLPASSYMNVTLMDCR